MSIDTPNHNEYLFSFKNRIKKYIYSSLFNVIIVNTMKSLPFTNNNTIILIVLSSCNNIWIYWFSLRCEAKLIRVSQNEGKK